MNLPRQLSDIRFKEVVNVFLCVIIGTAFAGFLWALVNLMHRYHCNSRHKADGEFRRSASRRELP